MRTLRHIAAVAGRELRAGAAPVALLAWVLFLAVQGLSFFALLAALADPRRPAPYGAVLRQQFGGSVLYWAFLFFVAVVLTMRLVADERRRGTWESLRTAPVHEGAIVVGKWLGALAAWAVLWAPTLVYPVLVAAFAPAGMGPDVGPVATAYLGVLVTGAAFLAIGLVASAATDSQVLAALLGFVVLCAWLLLGVLPELGALADRPTLGVVARAADVRRHMDDFARGVVDSRHLAVHGGVALVALAGAAALMGPRPREARARVVLGWALVVAGVLLGSVLVFRHPVRMDATRAGSYTLEARTRQILAEVRRPVRIYVMTAEEPAFAALYDEVLATLALFQAENRLVTIETIDPGLDPARVARVAEQHALAPEEVAGGGAVILTAQGAPGQERRRAIALLDMAEFAPGETGGVLTRFRAEAELAGALLEVAAEDEPEICFTASHGEPSLEASEDEETDDLSRLAQALRRDAARVSDIGALDVIPPRCAVIAVVGAVRPLAAGEQRALSEWLARGGRLFAAIDADLADDETLAPTGLERVVDRFGLRLGPGLVVDPAAAQGTPLTWATTEGYGEHPIAAAFRGRRATQWTRPRWIEPISLPGVEAAALVASSSRGWAETDLGTIYVRPPERDPGVDRGGPVTVAAAAEMEGGGRVVVFGSARPLGTRELTRTGAANDALAASAIAWLTGRRHLTGVPPKTPEQVRVVLTSEQLGRMFWVSVVGLPGVVGLVGALWLVRRRRRGR